jgi:hypothetical protein
MQQALQLPDGLALRNTQQADEPPARLDEIFQSIAVEDIGESRMRFLQRPPQNAAGTNDTGRPSKALLSICSNSILKIYRLQNMSKNPECLRARLVRAQSSRLSECRAFLSP